MTKSDGFDRRISLRLPETLAREIEEFISDSGMSFTEFLRRACREKLERETRVRDVCSTLGSYYSQEDFNNHLKAALSNEEIRALVRSISNNENKGRK